MISIVIVADFDVKQSVQLVCTESNVFRRMDFPKSVSHSDKEHLSSNDSYQAAMSELERTNQNIDISVNERSNAFSEESNDIPATSVDRPANNFIPSPTIHPQVFLGNLHPIRSSCSGSDEQHLHIPLLMHLDPYNTV